MRSSSILLRLALGMALLFVAGCRVIPTPSQERTDTRPALDSRHTALTFVPSPGTTNADQRFHTHALGGTVHFTPQGVALALPTGAPAEPRQAPTLSVVQWDFLGARTTPALTGLTPSDGTVSYLRGADPDQWQVGLATYAGVEYPQLYPGIDLRYEDNAGDLKATYFVAPGADPTAIRWRYQGAHAVAVAPDGSLQVTLAGTDAGTLTEAAPVAWQVDAGTQRPVAVAFAVAADDTVSFTLGVYDPSLPLVIDPVLSYSTFLGGSGADTPYYVTTDAFGNVYVGGYTTSANFPLTRPFQSASPQVGDFDFFLTKYRPNGTIVFSTYLGGNGDDRSYGIAVDNAGNPIIVGHTTSSNFPLYNARQNTRQGTRDGVVVKVAADGQSLIYSTLLGGAGEDVAYEVAAGPEDSVLVAGYTASTDFPRANPVQEQYGGGSYDGFLAQFSADGQSLPFSTFIGGSGEDKAFNVAVGPDGTIYTVGYTDSANYPTFNAYQPAKGAQTDAFLTAINPTLSDIHYSTFIGGNNLDGITGIAVDSDSNVYVVGETWSSTFPTKQAIQSTIGGQQDGFLTKVAAGGQSLVYSTFLGGPAWDGALSVAIDRNSHAYVTGRIRSSNYPPVEPIQAQFGGGEQDAFITVVDESGTRRRFNTYLGGLGSDTGVDIAVSPNGKLYVVGSTGSSNFPTEQPAQPQYGGGGTDGFLAAIDGVAPLPPVLVSVAPATLTFDGVVGGAPPVSQSLAIQLNGAEALAWTASADQPWITLTAPSGEAPGTLSVGVDLASLEPGAYTGVVLLIPDDPAVPPVQIPVTLGLVPAPEVVLTPTALQFAAVAGGAQLPFQNARISHKGPSPLTWSASADQPWIVVGAADGQTPAILPISVDLTDLAPGTYTGVVTVRATDPAAAAQELTITLRVDEPPPVPELSVTPAALRFTATVGAAPPPTQNVAIQHSGPADLTWTASADQPWIALDRTTGTAPAALEVRVRPAGLAPGTYSGTVTVQVSDPQVAARQVTVQVTVDPAEPPPAIALEARSGYRGIQLAWSPMRAVHVAAYRILRAPAGENPQTEIGRVRATRYLDTSDTLTSETRYCYRIEAVRANNTVLGRSNLACAVFGQVALWVPDVQGQPGQLAIIPVNIANATGLQIAAADIWLDLDGSVIEPVAVRATPLSFRYTWSYGVSTSGGATRVKIAALSGTGSSLAGDGSLFWLVVRVRGETGASTPLNLREYVTAVGGSTLYTTDNLAESVPLTLQDGTFRVGGAYRLGDLNGNGTIEAVDAYIVLQIAVGQLTATAPQRAAGDVNGNGRIDAADATLILYHAAHGDWPPLPDLEGAAQGLPQAGIMRDDVQVGLTSATGQSGEQLTVTLTTAGLSGWAGGQFIIAYDPAVVDRIDGVTLGAAAPTMGLRVHDDQAGLLTIALADDEAHESVGSLVTIRLTLRDGLTAGLVSPLVLADAQLNDASGRDFATSALSRVIVRGDGTVTVAQAPNQVRIYLPILQR